MQRRVTGKGRLRCLALPQIWISVDLSFWTCLDRLGLELVHGCLELHYCAVDQCPPSSLNMHFLCFIGVFEAVLDMNKIAVDNSPAKTTAGANFEARDICK